MPVYLDTAVHSHSQLIHAEVREHCPTGIQVLPQVTAVNTLEGWVEEWVSSDFGNAKRKRYGVFDVIDKRTGKLWTEKPIKVQR